MTDISQLSPGDKLSLKGKIFELQKRLNLLDVIQQNTEDFSFRPEITSYELPDRQKEDFFGNMNRAEVNRKEKLVELKTNLLNEETEVCTFMPNTRQAKFQSNRIKSDKPVFIRLTEKGLHYNESRKKLQQVFFSNGMACIYIFQ